MGRKKKFSIIDLFVDAFVMVAKAGKKVSKHTKKKSKNVSKDKFDTKPSPIKPTTKTNNDNNRISVYEGGLFYKIKSFFRKKSFEKREKKILIVKENSKLYSNILELNSNQSFDQVCDVIENKVCFSKNEYDKLDCYEATKNEMYRRESYFLDLINKAQNNKVKYEEYLEEYKKLEIYASIEEIGATEKAKISINEFVEIEKELYKKNLISCPKNEISFTFIKSYRSAQGRKFYSEKRILNQKTIISLIKEHKNQIQRQQELEREIKIKENEQRLKLLEKKEEDRIQKALLKDQSRKILSENKKKAKELQKREELLAKKEKAFEDATRGHIYAVNYEVRRDNQNNSIHINCDDMLKELKKSLDAGKISFEEYVEKRNSLL